MHPFLLSFFFHGKRGHTEWPMHLVQIIEKLCGLGAPGLYYAYHKFSNNLNVPYAMTSTWSSPRSISGKPVKPKQPGIYSRDSTPYQDPVEVDYESP